MKIRYIFSALLVSLMFVNLSAQVIRIDLKITDVDGNTVKVEAATSSAASGCASPDFPVMRSGEKVMELMEDYKYISVMHYEASSNADLYLTVELEDPKGKSEKVEMSKYLRFSGRAEGERVSVMLKDISMIEVFVEEE